MGERFGEYRVAWLAIAGTGLGLGWLVGQFNAGDSTPLPWLPSPVLGGAAWGVPK